MALARDYDEPGARALTLSLIIGSEHVHAAQIHHWPHPDGHVA